MEGVRENALEMLVAAVGQVWRLTPTSRQWDENWAVPYIHYRTISVFNE